MLIMFRVKNFASFRDEVILDLRAVTYKDMRSHVLQAGKNNVVKTMAIYGKNASGKSNLVSAMYYFESFIFNQFFGDDDRNDDISGRKMMPNARRTPYLLAEKVERESEFEMIFFHNNTVYQYGFSVEDGENFGSNISSEWLLVNDDEVFDRKNTEIVFGKKYEKELKDLLKIRSDRLYIGILDYFADGEIKQIVDGFKEYLKFNFNVHFELIIELSVKGIISGLNVSKQLIEDEKYRKTIEQFIRTADIGIEGLVVRRKNNDEDMGTENGFEVKTLHNKYDSCGKIIGQEEFSMEMESSGTIRYFSFIQYILNIIERGGVFVVDEMSARLHPILAKFIVDLFQSEENKKAQLIFTTHDTSLMNNKQFRRDEIAFVEKNRRGESSVYTLADIKVRSDASFSKDYMNGKYGAIPVIREEDIMRQLLEGMLWED